MPFKDSNMKKLHNKETELETVKRKLEDYNKNHKKAEADYNKATEINPNLFK